VQGSGASFGRRFVEPNPPQGQSLRPARSSGLFGLPLSIWIAAALVAGGLSFFWHSGAVRKAVSPADAAAIERVLAGGDISISPLEGIPNVSVEYYDVDATSATAIRDELNAKGPREADGKRFHADARTFFKWSWAPAPDGSCGTPNAEVSFSATIRLPRLTKFASLSPDLAQKWRSYMTALAFHEAGHVQIGYAGRDAIKAAVRSSSCSNAEAAAQAALATVQEEDSNYDLRSKHGAQEGATFH
jgi:predicted secreted Zn-dependent protease